MDRRQTTLETILEARGRATDHAFSPQPFPTTVPKQALLYQGLVSSVNKAFKQLTSGRGLEP
jgi:hypothetical protein